MNRKLTFIGREAEQEQLFSNIAMRQPTLLTGDIGIGKSRLLRRVHSKLEKVIYVETISPLKSALLEILQSLHVNDDLKIQGIEVEYLSWEELLKKLNRKNLKELETLILQNLKDKGYVLLLDSLEKLTPSAVPKVSALMEQTTIIGAANQLKPSLKKLWWRFEKIEIPPLTQEESRQLLWTFLNKDTITEDELLERKILNQANGNPLAIKELVDKVQREGNLTQQSIRELKHQAGTRFIDITPVFFIISALSVAARFIALGMNSTEMYIIAGISCGLFMGLRYFLYRSMRKED